MIKYNLVCADCGSEFEAWFPSIDAYDKQQAAGMLECASCGSSAVSKAIMAPNIPAKSNTRDDYRTLLRRAHQHIRDNFEDVGDRFADEAIAIYNGEAPEREIHGTVTREDRERLADEGVDYLAIPKEPEYDA